MRRFTRYSSLYFLLTVVLLGSFIASCEEYIDPPFELEEAKLVISSNFSPNEKVSVRLTASEPVVGSANVFEISNASVGIYEGQDLAETLVYTPGEDNRIGVYCTEDFHPQTGVNYTLKASAPGFLPVTASSSIPTSAEIIEVLVSDLDVTRTEAGLEAYHFELLVDYNDPTFAENFYDLRIKQLVVPFYVSSVTGDSVMLDPIFKAVESLTNATEENTRAGESSYLVADKPAGGIRVSLVSKINPKTEILGDLVVELRTVSRDYYNFQTGIQEERRIFNTYFERSVSGNFSNVGGGYGVFAGYSVVTRFFPLLD